MIKLSHNPVIIRFFTRFYYRKELKRLSKNYFLFQEIIKIADSKYRSFTEDKFPECYLTLSNRLLIDIVSTKLLWERGLYGSAHVVLAVIERNLRMMGALLLSPDLIQDFLNEEKTSDKDQSFRRKFRESKLQEILDGRFGKNERGELINSDKVLHGSSAGAKVFYARIRHNSDGTKGGDLIFNAFFEEEKSSAIINILNGAIIDLCGIFLEKYHEDSELMKKYNELLKTELKSTLRQQLYEQFKKN